MHSRRRVLALAAAAVAGCSGTDDTEDATGTSASGSDDASSTDENGLAVTTGAFADGGSIPERYTFDGADVSPPFTFERIPSGADTVAVRCIDGDAGGFVHWLCWNVPADRDGLPEGVPQAGTVSKLDGAQQGTNGFGELGYRGPKPPAGAGPHTYTFTFFAVDGSLDLDPGADLSAFGDALEGHVVGEVVYSGRYER
ncbi:MAG: YbhB/YbcL family Raf kinase inhibitor-like protein [Haloarculaceae archaeon]